MNEFGEFGNGTTSEVIQRYPAEISSATWKHIYSHSNFTAGIKMDNTLWTWGLNRSSELGTGIPGPSIETSPVLFGGTEEYQSFANGAYHSLALKTNGTCMGFGYNDFGQLGFEGNSFQIVTPQAIPCPSLAIDYFAASSHFLYTRILQAMYCTSKPGTA